LRFNGAAPARARMAPTPLASTFNQTVASTGPRPRGRGWVVAMIPVSALLTRLQRGRARAGADGPASPTPRSSLPPRFNGAAPARARMGNGFISCGACVHLASTGPRPRGRGWEPVCRQRHRRVVVLQRGRARAGADGGATATITSAALPGFNGAAPARARMGRWMGAGWWGWRCFNGAAPARARMAALRDGQNPASLHASTGPRPRGRGWDKRRPSRGRCQRASTGPRPRGRGWPVAPWTAQADNDRLQRGRARAGADGNLDRRLAPRAGRASTGPRPRGRGWCQLARTPESLL